MFDTDVTACQPQFIQNTRDTDDRVFCIAE